MVIGICSSGINETARRIAEDARTIEDQAFRRAFRRDLPSELLSAVEERFLRADFFRSEQRAIWRMKNDLVNGEHRIRTEVTTTIETQNISDEPKAYTPKFGIDERSASAGPGAKIISIEIDGTPKSIDNFKREGNEWYYYDTFTLPPKGTIRINTVFEFSRYMNDHEIYTTTVATRSMSVIVYFPDDKDPDSERNEFFKLDTIGNFMSRRSKGRGWREIYIPGVVLPDQGVLMHWRFVKIPDTDKSE